MVRKKNTSIEKGIEEVLKILNEDEIQAAIGKGRIFENVESNLNQELHHSDAVKLDLKCVDKGKSPPLLNSHKYILDEGSRGIKTESFDVDDLLVKFTILDGDLKKVVKESQDPSSPQGVKLDHIEKKKIFESIKKIEDKILKIKIAIDKGRTLIMEKNDRNKWTQKFRDLGKKKVHVKILLNFIKK